MTEKYSRDTIITGTVNNKTAGIDEPLLSNEGFCTATT